MTTIKVKAHKNNKWAWPVEIKKGKLNQKGRLREANIPSWNVALLAAKGI